MKLGYSTWGMPTVPVDTAIRHLAQLGYDGIELTVIPRYTTELSTLDSVERKRIAGLLKAHHLALPAIAAHSNLLATDAQAHAQSMWRLKGAVDLAVDLAQGDELPVIETTPGGQPEQWEGLKSLLVDRIGELVEYAQSRGVTIAMEPHVGAIIETPQKMLELLDLIGSPHFKVNFDISHFDVIGMTIEETVSVLAPHSVHTHVKDQRGRYPDFEFLIPGEGNFDYVAYLKAMQKHGYDRFITAEVSVMVQRRENYDPLAAATLSYETLSRAFIEAGIGRGA
jgi:sugar phosphate isomerase/epimerase